MKYIHIMHDVAQKIIHRLDIDIGKVVTKKLSNMGTWLVFLLTCRFAGLLVLLCNTLFDQYSSIACAVFDKSL